MPDDSTAISSAAAALYSRDESAVALGIELIEAGPDRAVCRMPVRADMCNGFDIIHGGMTFLLADSAMAFASNSQPDVALATSANIDWLAPVSVGSTLVATAVQAWSGGRSNVWEITVQIEDGPVVALIRGRTRRVGQPAS